MQDATEREALSSFLKIAPAERWTVADALQHDLFNADDQTTTEIEGHAGAGARPREAFPENFNVLGLDFGWIQRRIFPWVQRMIPHETPFKAIFED